MANRPNFDLNKQDPACREDHRRNRAITDMVEPGSTFKIVTAAAALTERMVRPDTMIFCENGYLVLRATLHDHHPYADLTVERHPRQIEQHRRGQTRHRNSATRRFYEYVRRFGFGERTGVASARRNRRHRPSAASLEQDFDHAHADGPGGRRHAAADRRRDVRDRQWRPADDAADRPRNHRRRGPDDRAVPAAGSAARRFARSRATPCAMRWSRWSAKKGTAPLAHVPGFKVAGKTGHRAKGRRERRLRRTTNTSFPSSASCRRKIRPSSRLVMLDEAQAKHGENYGGLVAAPVFSRIGERAARYLGLTPTAPRLPDGTVVARSTPRDSRDQ